MQLAKTEKAREALHHRDPCLSAQDRRILIVSDGRRKIDELVSMLGEGIAEPIERLLRDGYLTGMTVPGADRAGLASASNASTVASPSPAPASAVPATVPGPSGASASTPRRSLVAARMYMLDMLQLLRNDEASAHADAIRAAQGGDAMVGRLLEALRHIRASTSTSYSERVGTRLGEVLPSEYLSRLAAPTVTVPDIAPHEQPST